MPVLRRELDLLADERFRLRDLRTPGRASPSVARFDSIHWDSPDHRLAGWEAGLSYRRGRGWRVTLLGEAEPAGMRRLHLDLPGPPGSPPPQALRLLGGYLRGATVEPVARLRHRESCVTLRGVRVVHRVATLMEGGRGVARARRVSLLLPGDAEAARRPLAALRRAGVAAVAELPILAQLLGSPAAPLWRERRLDGETCAQQAVAAALCDCAARLVRNQALLLEGSDPEGVHQTRVACRRYRSALQTFAPLLVPAWEEDLHEQLRALADLLGRVRDAEVLLLRLRAAAADRGLQDCLTAGLFESLEREREDGRDALLRRIESREHREQLDRILAAAITPAVLPGTADSPASAALMPLVAASWRSLRRRAHRLGSRPTDRELHRARIAAKRCRYAVLALVPLLGDEPARTAALLGRLQDTLGEQHDAVLAAEWLSEHAGPDTAFAAGVLFGAERERAERGRSLWQKRWRAVDRREVWRWTRV